MSPVRRGAMKALTRFTRIAALTALVYAAIIVIDGLIDDIQPSDVGIVLGSKVELNGQPSLRLKARLDKAVELYREGVFDKLIVSGGFAPEGYDEATVMHDYMVRQGVPLEAILVDSLGVNTAATAKNGAALMRQHGFESAMVVTQYFHIPRSRMALHDQGVRKVRTAHADFFEIRDLYSILREMAAIPVYWWKAL